MFKVIALLLMSLVALGAGVPKQQPEAPAQEKKDEKAENKPEDKSAKYIKLTIVPIEYSHQANDYVPVTQFKVGALMRAALMMRNTSDQPLTIFNIGAFHHNRLRLLKDGSPVHYFTDALRSLKASEDNNGEVFISTREFTLAPNREARYDLIDLSEWYGHLQPGHYELTIKHRFQSKGKWVESNTVTFDVVQ